MKRHLLKTGIIKALSVLIFISVATAFLPSVKCADCDVDFVCKKGDQRLIEAIGEADSNTTIPVAAFFSTIDYSQVEITTRSRLKGVVSEEILEIVFNGRMYTALSREKAKSQMELVIKTENEVIEDLTKKQTQEDYNKVFTTEKPEIISSGTYTPNINMYMTKDQIAIADNSSIVKQLRYVDPSVYEKQKAPVKMSKIPYFVSAPKSLLSGQSHTMEVSDGSQATWTTSNKKIATVSKGKITALDKGTSTIKAEFDTGIVLSIVVNVTTSPKLSSENVNIKKGSVITLKLTGKAKGINNKYYNTKYAKITSPVNSSTIKIKGIKKGTSNLKVKVNGVKILTIKVKVKK